MSEMAGQSADILTRHPKHHAGFCLLSYLYATRSSICLCHGALFLSSTDFCHLRNAPKRSGSEGTYSSYPDLSSGFRVYRRPWSQQQRASILIQGTPSWPSSSAPTRREYGSSKSYSSRRSTSSYAVPKSSQTMICTPV